MEHSGMTLGAASNSFEAAYSSERNQLSVSLREFSFDAETLRGNHQWVTVTAREASDHTALFVIALDQSSAEGEASDYKACSYRAHGAPGQTEVIVGLLPRAAMRALVRAILAPDSPPIALGVSTCD